MYIPLSITINLGIVTFLVYSVAQKIARKPNRFLKLSSPELPEILGTEIGFKLSLALSITYAFFSVLIIETFTSYNSGMGNFWVVWFWGSPVIFFMAILPAILYGCVTGFLLGIAIKYLGNWLSSTSMILLGILLCIILVVISHLIFHVQITFSFFNSSSRHSYDSIYQTYLFSIGLPSVLYSLSGGWASWFIYKNFKSGHKPG